MLSCDVGTPNWSAPELLQEAEYDRSIDVYSFGIMMWELVSRKLPWGGIVAADLDGFKAALSAARRHRERPAARHRRRGVRVPRALRGADAGVLEHRAVRPPQLRFHCGLARLAAVLW